MHTGAGLFHRVEVHISALCGRNIDHYSDDRHDVGVYCKMHKIELLQVLVCTKMIALNNCVTLKPRLH